MLSDEEIEAWEAKQGTRFTHDEDLLWRALRQAKAANTLAKALRFYADAKRLTMETKAGNSDGWQHYRVINDNGQTARQALLAVGLMEKEENNGK